jgi:hypothetical protein
MSKRASKVSGWFLGVLAVGSLVLGLSVAAAKPASSLTCANDGWNWVGSQPDAATCQSVCVSIHGPDTSSHWNPTTTCCTCLF